MTRLGCCRLHQVSLNELPSSRVVKLPEERPSALISDISPTSSSSAHDLQPIRDIFAFSSEDPDPSETERFSDRDVGPKRAMLFSARRKEGNRKLREIARILRSRISRESEVSKKGSKKGSKKKTRSDASEEDIERRKELKRALHRRLEEELLQDKTSEEGYDADAIPIKTPNGTWSRTDGSSRYDSGRLRPGVGRFEPPSPSLGRGLDQQHHPSNYGGQRRASTSTKVQILNKISCEVLANALSRMACLISLIKFWVCKEHLAIVWQKIIISQRLAKINHKLSQLGNIIAPDRDSKDQM